MAIFRLEAKVFSREKRGRSVIAAAAYRAGAKLKDERTDKTYDYSRKSGVIRSVILAPEAAPGWAKESETLWNTVERGEKRVDAQLAREFILSLPKELDEKQRWETAVAWAQAELVSRGMVAEVSLHHSKDGRNPHAHILCTMRKLNGDTFSAKKAREWNDDELLISQRESWAKAVNAALEQAGRDERVDHRSLKDQGIDRIPEPKIGVAATAMKRKGKIFDCPAFERVRRVRFFNAVRPFIQSMAEDRPGIEIGAGSTWWERSASFMTRMRERAGGMVKDAWQKYLDSRAVKEGKDGPDIDR